MKNIHWWKTSIHSKRTYCWPSWPSWPCFPFLYCTTSLKFLYSNCCFPFPLLQKMSVFLEEKKLGGGICVLYFFLNIFFHPSIIKFLVADTRLYTLVRCSVGPSHFWITSGFCTTAPAQPSATGLPCIRPCLVPCRWLNNMLCLSVCLANHQYAFFDVVGGFIHKWPRPSAWSGDVIAFPAPFHATRALGQSYI